MGIICMCTCVICINFTDRQNPYLEFKTLNSMHGLHMIYLKYQSDIQNFAEKALLNRKDSANSLSIDLALPACP